MLRQKMKERSENGKKERCREERNKTGKGEKRKSPPVISKGAELAPLLPFWLRLHHFPIRIRSVVTLFAGVAEVRCRRIRRYGHGVQGVAVVEPDMGVVDLPFFVTPLLSENESRSAMSNSLNIPFTKWMWRMVWIGSGMENALVVVGRGGNGRWLEGSRDGMGLERHMKGEIEKEQDAAQSFPGSNLSQFAPNHAARQLLAI
jgi:hypothetical protein